MSTQRHYSKPPIVEAILDFQVRLPAGKSMADLENVGAGEIAQYPKKSTDKRTLDISQQTSATVITQQTVFVFKSCDGNQVFEVHGQGFSFHRLAPYDRWETFRNEAQRLWRVYRALAQPTQITRLAVRYVNRLDLPGGSRLDLKQYFRTFPKIAPELPQAVAGLFMQLDIPQNDIGATLRLTQALAKPLPASIDPIIIDIDLFRNANLPTDEAEVWRVIEQLHTRHNEIFESCITDQTRELIK